MNAFMSLSKDNLVNRRMALLVALGVGTAGALALAYCLCRFYRTPGRSPDADRRNAEERERRSIDSSQEDELVSEGELSGEESGAEKRKVAKVHEEKAEDNVKSGLLTQNPTNTQISPYEDNAIVYEFGPLPEDKGTYIVSPKRTSTPTTKLFSQVAASKPVSGKLHQNPIFAESTSESLKHDSQLGMQVKPNKPKEKRIDGKLKEIESQEETTQLLSDDAGEILGESNPSLKQHHGIPVIPAELKEKVAEGEIKVNGEEEKTHNDIPKLPHECDEILDQPSKSSDGVLKLQVEQSKNESEKKNGEDSQSEASQTPPDTSGTSAQASTSKSPNHQHGTVISAELKENLAKRKSEDSNKDETSTQSSSQASNGKSTSPPVAPKPKPKSPEQPTSESPNRLRGISVMPAGLAEKLSERKQKVHNGVESEEETSEQLPAVRQEAAAHSEGVSLDSPVQVSPLHHLSRNKGPARRPPTRTPTRPVV